MPNFPLSVFGFIWVLVGEFGDVGDGEVKSIGEVVTVGSIKEEGAVCVDSLLGDDVIEAHNYIRR